MKHAQRIQNAIEYIEKHLSEHFTLTDVSAAAFSSLSYMHRIFYQMAGTTMKDYIRQRRLSQAVNQLRHSKDSILDVALNAGFQSAESFTRAFKKQFELNPSQCRQSQSELVLFEPLDMTKQYTFTLPDQLDFDLHLTAVHLQQQKVLGFMTHTTLDNDQQVIDICQFANEVMSSDRLVKHFDLSQSDVFGVYTNMSDENDFDYTIAAAKSSCTEPSDELVAHRIEGGSYARFELSRNDRIKEAWHYIYGVWFPQIDALRTYGYDFEIYYPDTTAIYIPMSAVPMGPLEPNQ